MLTACRLGPVLCLALCLAPLGGARGADLRITVVAARGKGGPNLQAAAKRFLEKPLKEKATVVPFVAYKKAARKAKVRGKAITKVESAAAIGAAAGLSHVLVVEGIAVREQVGRVKKKVFYANVTLVRVEENETLHTKRYPLTGRRLTSVVADEVLAAVHTALQPPAAPEPEPEPTAAAQPALPDPPQPPPEAEGGPGELQDAGAQLATAPGEATPTAEEAPAEPPAEEAPPADAAATAEIPAPNIPKAEPPPREPSRERAHRGRWRPGLRLGLGVAGFQRVGRLAARGHEPPFYGAEEGQMSPFFPGGGLRLELFPLAFFGDGRWYEGFGVHADGLFNPKVQTDIGPGDTVESFVYMVNGGLSFRLVWWQSLTAPDFQLKLGYCAYRFPLKGGAFPGVHIGAPYVGGTFSVPLLETLALTVGGHYKIHPSGRAGAKHLGEQKSASGFRAEGGLRLTFAPIEFSLLGRMDRYKLEYEGATNLINSSQQYDNVTLTDRIISGWLIAGIVF